MQTSTTDTAEVEEHPVVEVTAKEIAVLDIAHIPEELIELPSPETLQVIEEQLNAVNNKI
jgi:hypothetical protein